MGLKYWRVVVAALVGLSSAQAEVEPRLALVIGNAHYAGKYLQELVNPINDAKLMAETLKQAGFEVVTLADADQMAMKRAIAAFGEHVATAGPETTAAFYYAGHGVQVGGTAYLIPIGAEIAGEADVDLEALSLDELAMQLAFAGSKVSILMLDAGRSNGLTRGFRSVERGLAELGLLDQGMFVSYASAPGKTAVDGHGGNGPYATAVSKAILTPGLTIHEVFERARAEVYATAKGQLTVDTSTLSAPFYFLRKD